MNAIVLEAAFTRSFGEEMVADFGADDIAAERMLPIHSNVEHATCRLSNVTWFGWAQ